MLWSVKGQLQSDLKHKALYLFIILCQAPQSPLLSLSPTPVQLRWHPPCCSEPTELTFLTETYTHVSLSGNFWHSHVAGSLRSSKSLVRCGPQKSSPPSAPRAALSSTWQRTFPWFLSPSSRTGAVSPAPKTVPGTGSGLKALVHSSLAAALSCSVPSLVFWLRFMVSLFLRWLHVCHIPLAVYLFPYFWDCILVRHNITGSHFLSFPQNLVEIAFLAFSSLGLA